MIARSYQQFAIVQGDTAQQLSDELNAKLYELRDKSPTVMFEGMIARIQYIESERVPETIAEEYELQGVQLVCEDCPYFCPTIKADGSLDRRAKWGGCHLSEYGRTDKRSRACEELYRRLNDGRIRLCAEDGK